MRKMVFNLILITILLFSVASAAADTIYLRDGRTIKGTVLGYVNGRFAVRLTSSLSDRRDVTGSPVSRTQAPNEEGEIVFFRPSEIDRIEIDGRSLDELRFETRTVQVSLGPDWTDSGVDLHRDERVQIRASGTILTGRSRITPDGLRTNDPNAPLPRAAEGLLVGAVGNDPDSPIVELGAAREFVADRDGRLYLTANRGSYNDARGAFTVQIRRERDLNALADQSDNDRYGRRRDTIPGPARSRTRQTGDSERNRGTQEVTLEVPATSRGTDTNIDLREGDQITFVASGTIVAGRRIGQVGPQGGRLSGFGAIVGTRPVPSAGPGALIGYVRLSNGQTSQPFLIGNQLTLTAPADGRLFVGVNDDDYSDNSGSFSVRIRY